jgi:hypothetical protein
MNGGNFNCVMLFIHALFVLQKQQEKSMKMKDGGNDSDTDDEQEDDMEDDDVEGNDDDGDM